MITDSGFFMCVSLGVRTHTHILRMKKWNNLNHSLR